MSSNQSNPGNFANRTQEQVENIARKGDQQSHQGGFASMDPFGPTRQMSGGFTARSQRARDSQRRGSRQAFMFDETEMPDD